MPTMLHSVHTSDVHSPCIRYSAFLMLQHLCSTRKANKNKKSRSALPHRNCRKARGPAGKAKDNAALPRRKAMHLGPAELSPGRDTFDGVYQGCTYLGTSLLFAGFQP